MARLIVAVIIYLILSCTESCGPHHDERVEYSIRNASEVPILIDSYFNGFNYAGEIRIAPGESFFTGGGGILDSDSALFVRISSSSSIWYRNRRHGDDIFTSNHFFHYNNWVEESYNKYFYNVRDEDFEQ